MTKTERRAAIRARAASAIRNLYHNAMPELWRLDDRGLGERTVSDWFDDAARAEIDYIIENAAANRSIARVVELTQTVESFNAHGEAWNSRENLQALFDDENLADASEAAGIAVCK